MEKLAGVNVGSFHLFKAFVISWNMIMLITGHRFTDAGADAIGSVKRAAVFLDLFDRAVS